MRGPRRIRECGGVLRRADSRAAGVRAQAAEGKEMNGGGKEKNEEGKKKG